MTRAAIHLPSAFETELLRTVVESGDGTSPYRILADWLEERDGPLRAEYLRLRCSLLETCCEPQAHPDRGEWQARVVELLAAGVPPCVPLHEVMLSKKIRMTFAFVPAGRFLQGGAPEEQGRFDDEGPTHPVRLSRGYYLGVYPVTQAQWKDVMGSNPSEFQEARYPVEQVTWHDCLEFCAKLGERDGRHYRLPTEAEWEYACRAGTSTAYWTGNGLDALKRAGHYSANTASRGSRPVGQLLPNPWGLYDLHGNVWEWCLDGEGDYRPGELTDPVAPDHSADKRVLRGGSWCNSPRLCRSAVREGRVAGYSRNDAGFRVVLCPG